MAGAGGAGDGGACGAGASGADEGVGAVVDARCGCWEHGREGNVIASATWVSNVRVLARTAAVVVAGANAVGSAEDSADACGACDECAGAVDAVVLLDANAGVVCGECAGAGATDAVQILL